MEATFSISSFFTNHLSQGRFICPGKDFLPFAFNKALAINTKALRHENVVKLLDYGYSENIFFFTMEYCERGSVTNLIVQKGGRLSVDIAVPIILQVLTGLDYAHNAEIPNIKLGSGGFGKGRGLVHRDLKPSNIFLSNVNDKLTVKIGDYGLAKAFDLAG